MAAPGPAGDRAGEAEDRLSGPRADVEVTTDHPCSVSDGEPASDLGAVSAHPPGRPLLRSNHDRIVRRPRRPTFFPAGSTLLLAMAAACSVLVLLSPATGVSVSDCKGVNYAYRERGLNLRNVPRQPRQGTQLQICPRGLTCCTEEMERQLRTSSRESYRKAMQQAAAHTQRMFNNRANRFDEFFTDLLATSKLKFHKLFQKTYGIIYERNSDVFIDFFKDLEEYYDRGEVNLEDALRKFFSQLYQRMFIVFNAQHSFDYEYLSCVSHTMKSIQPFGDVPKKLTEQLRRSFVATRTFAQALMQAKQILNRILKIAPKDECVKALTKMSSCPACQGIPEVRPCPDYCINVMKGCLAYHAELGESWDQFIENLQILSDRLVGPFDIEAVVDPIGVKISEAIMNFQDSGYEVTSKVFQNCGTPSRQKRQTNYGYAYGSGGQSTRPLTSGSTGRHYNSGSAGGRSSYDVSSDHNSKLKQLLKEIRQSVEEAKGFWTRLPEELCQSESVGTGEVNSRQARGNGHYQHNGNSCWNGRDKGRYSYSVVDDGLKSQSANPEVPVDVSRPDVDINEQILALKLMTNKLESAYNGQPVEWETSSNRRGDHEGSGDGGDCDGPYSDDEDCYDDWAEYEGSGSGDDDGEYYYEEEEDDDDGAGGQNWPPWVTTPRPSTRDGDDDDIRIEAQPPSSRAPDQMPAPRPEEENDTRWGRRPPPAQRPSSAAARAAASAYFLVPVVTILIGNAVAL